MSESKTHLPGWLTGRRYCTVKHLMRLFDVSRATIDRWSRDIPTFPNKLKLGPPGRGNCSTRFLVSEVATYVDTIDSGGIP